jgi:hypothetical protein
MEVTWNNLDFKRLDEIRVRICKNISAIVVPVDLLAYIFGRRCPPQGDQENLAIWQ